MTVDMEVDQETWDRIAESDGSVLVCGQVGAVTVRLKDSLLVEERRCARLEFLAAGVLGKEQPDDGSAQVRIWLAPEEAGGV